MSHAPEQVRFCTSPDGVRIAYEISGAGPPLVWVQHWVHHLVSDWDSLVWAPWLSALTRRFTVIRYDWRGCGLSDRDQIAVSLERFADDLKAVVDSVGLDRFVLFGMAGAGCGAAMRYAAENSERVSRLVLFAPHTKGRLAGSPGSEAVKEAEARFKLIELGWVNAVPAYSEFFTRLHIPDASSTQQESYINLLRQTASAVNAARLVWAFWHVELDRIIPKVACPTLVCHGRHDCVIPFEEGRRVASMLPDARFVPLQTRNHVLLGNELGWQQFLDAFDEFTSASRASPGSLAALTAREREIMDLLAQGHDNRIIAARLRIAEKTARNHVSSVFRKLGVSSRAQAVAFARDLRSGLPNRSGR